MVVPLDQSEKFEAVRVFARKAMKFLANEQPDSLTIEARKEKRKGRIYLDTLANAYAQTSVPLYAVRALRGAPIATPLERNR